MLVDSKKASQSEAERRLNLLGALATAEYDYDLLQERSKTVFVPLSVLKDWHDSYRQKGVEGLRPNWSELDEPSQGVVMERYKQLGDLADAETVGQEQLEALAERNGWLLQRAKRWLVRYRIGGLWALAPQYDPDKVRRQKKAKPVVRELGSLDEAVLEEGYRRREILGELADKPKASATEVEERARQMGISKRTLWNYLRSYREHGLAGLMPQQRGDVGKRHGLSETVEQIVVGIRLSKKDWRVRAVHEEACKRARELGEQEPSEWQVRAICNSIPKPVKLLADGRTDTFRNKFRLTFPMQLQGVVYQIDHTPVDVLVRDMRGKKYRKERGEIRLWLTTCLEANSRLLMSAKFGYDRPDRFTLAAVIRDALLVSDTKAYGGLPNEIWVDNGKELISKHVQQGSVPQLP